MHIHLGGDTHAEMRKDRNGHSQTFSRTNAKYAKPHKYIQQPHAHRCTGISLYRDAHVDLYMGVRVQTQTHEPVPIAKCMVLGEKMSRGGKSA